LLMRVLLVFAYVLCFFSFAMMLPFRRNKDGYNNPMRSTPLSECDVQYRLSLYQLERYESKLESEADRPMW